MLTVKWSKFFLKAKQNQPRGNVEVGEELTSLQVKQVPYYVKELVLAVMWFTDTEVRGRYSISMWHHLRLVREFHERPFDYPAVRPGSEFNTLISLPDVTFPEVGNYIFEIFYNGVVVHSMTLECSKLQ